MPGNTEACPSTDLFIFSENSTTELKSLVTIRKM